MIQTSTRPEYRRKLAMLRKAVKKGLLSPADFIIRKQLLQEQR